MVSLIYFSLVLHSLKLQASPYAVISGQAVPREMYKKQIKTSIFLEMNAGVGFFVMLLEILLSCLAIFSALSELWAWSCDADPAPVYGTADG